MSLENLGPVFTTTRKAQSALENLWQQTGVEARAYTGNMIALTTSQHLEKVKEALAGLQGRHAGRQIIGVMDAGEGFSVSASLLQQEGGVYVERILLESSPEQLQGAIFPLLRPATVNHVWWAADTQPRGELLKELSEVADQIIANSLSLDIAPSKHYSLADLGWSRSAGWREALAQVFDSKDAASQLKHCSELTVRYAGDKKLPAVLFAGFVGSALGWSSIRHVKLEQVAGSSREGGDLCGLELGNNKDVSFILSAESGSVKVNCQWQDISRTTSINIQTMSLAQGLERVMSRIERTEVFESAWRLAKALD